ncbi:MAG: PDZ domain-containing protein [Bacillota bacterium]
MLPADFFSLVLKTFVRAVTDPIFFVLLLLIGLQYRRAANLKSQLYKVPPESHWLPLFRAALLGAAGGLLGGFIMALVGISLSGIGVIYLWGLAILFMLVSPRLVCFSYAGGTIALCSLIFGFPKVDVPSLMGLVAVLHLVESLLILANGHEGAVPVYTRNRQGRVVGAFYMQKFWPIPVVALQVVLVSQNLSAGDLIPMPDWWPLLRSALPPEAPGMRRILVLVPVLAALGYSDLAMTSTPRKKCRWSAFHLGLYSLALLLLAVLASYTSGIAWAAALFAPLGHELLLRYGQKKEQAGTPLFVPNRKGLLVLDVLPGYPAQALGLQTGDLILGVNGFPVHQRDSLRQALEASPGWVEVEYLSGNRWRRGLVPLAGEELGLIPVPEADCYPHVTTQKGGMLSHWWKSWSHKREWK